jgi:hypothetical protein
MSAILTYPEAIILWVLDLGMRDAETWFAARQRPGFLQVPELA